MLVPTPQDHTQATDTSRIEKEHGLLDPHKPVQENFSRWKAYTPWPGLYFELNDKKVIVEQCSFVHGKQSRHVGQVVELESHLDFPLPGEMHRPKKIFGIIHPDGVLILLQVKPE